MRTLRPRGDGDVATMFWSNTALSAQAALSGGREKLGSISKQGDRYLRSLFVVAALAVIFAVGENETAGPGQVPETGVSGFMS
jgi:transposase